METLEAGSPTRKKENFKKGDILVYTRYCKYDIPGRYFKCTLVDEDWGVVGYKYGGINDTIGVAYVRKANLFEKMLYYIL